MCVYVCVCVRVCVCVCCIHGCVYICAYVRMCMCVNIMQYAGAGAYMCKQVIRQREGRSRGGLHCRDVFAWKRIRCIADQQAGLTNRPGREGRREGGERKEGNHHTMSVHKNLTRRTRSRRRPHQRRCNTYPRPHEADSEPSGHAQSTGRTTVPPQALPHSRPSRSPRISSATRAPGSQDGRLGASERTRERERTRHAFVSTWPPARPARHRLTRRPPRHI